MKEVSLSGIIKSDCTYIKLKSNQNKKIYILPEETHFSSETMHFFKKIKGMINKTSGVSLWRRQTRKRYDEEPKGTSQLEGMFYFFIQLVNAQIYIFIISGFSWFIYSSGHILSKKNLSSKGLDLLVKWSASRSHKGLSNPITDL